MKIIFINHILLNIIGLILTTNMVLAQENVEIKKLKAGHRTIYTEIIIDASSKQVWNVLLDQKNMPSWSNTFTMFEGEFKDGAQIKLHVKAKPTAKKVITVEHQLIYKENDYFGWNDSKIMGMKDNHKFIVQDMGNGKTRFIQSDEVRGGMTWLMGKMMMNIQKRLYTTFNKELKAEVEKRANS